MKRAPAATWNPLTRLLRSLEVGESGVLRLPLGGPPPDCPDHGPSCPDFEWEQMSDGTWTDGWTGYRTPPLRPGRYWVPEEWTVVQSGLGRHSARPDRFWVDLRYSDGDHRRAWLTKASTWVWHHQWSDRMMPRWAARLACEVGEGRVEAWCEACQGSRRKVLSPPRAKADGTFSCSHAIVCPTCSGEPGPWWVYDVQRLEAPDA